MPTKRQAAGRLRRLQALIKSSLALVCGVCTPGEESLPRASTGMRTIVNRDKQSTGEDHGSVKGLKKETLTMLTEDHPPSLPLMRKQGVKVPQIVCGRVQIQDQGQLPKPIHFSSQPHSWMTFGISSLWNLGLPWGYTEPCARVPARGIRGVTRRRSQHGPHQTSMCVLQALDGEIQGDLGSHVLKAQSLHQPGSLNGFAEQTWT